MADAEALVAEDPCEALADDEGALQVLLGEHDGELVPARAPADVHVAHVSADELRGLLEQGELKVIRVRADRLALVTFVLSLV